MKCTAYSRDSTVLDHVEKPEEELGEIKGRTVSTQKTFRSPVVTSISSSPLDPKHKGPHNKENYQEKRLSQELPSDDELVLSSSCVAEDSGYLSLQNSRVESVESDDVHQTERSEEKSVCSQSSDTGCHSTPCLPVLRFQEEVCRELAKSFKKSKSYDWTVIDKVAENYGLCNVIGGKMGLEFVDVLCGLLRKDMRHVLAKILGLLGDSDLVSCRKVSRTWRKIICQDQVSLQRCRDAERKLRDSGRPVASLSRDFTLSRVVFSSMQAVASTPLQKVARKLQSQTSGSRSSRFQQFHEAARLLKPHESLRACVLCGSPARFDAVMQRAACTRISCAFESCTQCHSAFHSSAPCRRAIRTFSAPQNTLIAGSARSKRSVRRL